MGMALGIFLLFTLFIMHFNDILSRALDQISANTSVFIAENHYKNAGYRPSGDFFFRGH